MPYFSFSLKQNLLNKNDKFYNNSNITLDTTYFSKSTNLWKYFSKNNNQKYINFLKFEPRLKIKEVGKRILFCLPPGIGFGDIIEYSIAINQISTNKLFDKIGIAFVGQYLSFIKKNFKFNNLYDDFIEYNEMLKYDTIFHLSLEIKEFKLQKYLRSDIESVILKYFDIKKKPQFSNKINNEIKEINIFPISKSPIRSLQPKLIEGIINSFSNKYNINIIFDDSPISSYIENNIKVKNYKKFKPHSLEDLCQLIKNTQFGIFPDSGPLHFAKINKIKGVLITTTVGGEVLLSGYNTIKEIPNSFISNFCKSPCGLTNLINFQNKAGCYDSLNLKKNDFLKNINLNRFQRGSIRDKYIEAMINPVGCIKKININVVIEEIKTYINR